MEPDTKLVRSVIGLEGEISDGKGADTYVTFSLSPSEPHRWETRLGIG
jgi:hypothetical protein